MNVYKNLCEHKSVYKYRYTLYIVIRIKLFNIVFDSPLFRLPPPAKQCRGPLHQLPPIRHQKKKRNKLDLYIKFIFMSFIIYNCNNRKQEKSRR